jgi:peptidyl-prolyl cis-trans isomerase B (cyclophilin B)
LEYQGLKLFIVKLQNLLQSILAFVILLSPVSQLQAQTAAHTLIIETSMGRMICVLYQETPMHSDNFLELVNQGFYDGQLFHRVIDGFMIQTGDPDSKGAEPGELLGRGGVDYTIPAEFHPSLYHRKGSLGAARQGDDINPNRESSGSQFYIVQGKQISDQEMDAMENSGHTIPFTPEQRKVYKTLGGTPHLDYAYTVFGRVIEGYEVIDRIAAVQTDRMNRPLKDVRIIKIRVME